MFTIYRLDTGEIVKTFVGPVDLLEPNVPDGCSALPGDFNDATHRVDVSAQPHIAVEMDAIVDSDTVLRQSTRITAIRNQLRDAPITLANGWRFDADTDSVEMMKERVDRWDAGTMTRDEQGRQMWKDADNQRRYFTREEFTEFVDEIRHRRAVRHDTNFAYGEQMRALLPLPADHPVFDPESWPG